MFYNVKVSKQYVYATVTTFPHLHFFSFLHVMSVETSRSVHVPCL